MPTVKLYLSIGFATAKRTETEYIDDDLWDSLSEDERQDYLDELAKDWANNHIEIDAFIEGDE